MSLQDLSLDIRAFIRTATALALFFSALSWWRGFSLLRNSDEMPYFRLRQQRVMRGWRSLVFGFVFLVVGIWLGVAGEESAYRVFPVTETPTLTPTITTTPSPTLSPTITLTPSETPTLEFTYTPSPTPIPELPQSIINLFEASVTPNPGTLFSPLTFSTGLDLETYTLSGVSEIFQNPVGVVYATFSYDLMLNGVQWTALWYRGGELVHFETSPWDGGTGGLGFTEWSPDAEEWLPSTYQVQIFVGVEPKAVGNFVVEGEAVTSTPTPSPTSTTTPTATRTLTPTITATHTRFPTDTFTP